MEVLKADEEGLERAVDLLHEGKVVALPTDTVYGLAVATRVPRSAEKLFIAKGRREEVPIPVLVGDIKQAQAITGVWPSFAIRMATRYWPGPLTIVLKRAPGWDVYLGKDKTSVGVRQPDSDFVMTLAKLVGPLATTSANKHGKQPLSSAEEIAKTFSQEEVAAVVDGGVLEGPPSTVVDCTTLEAKLLREGAIPWSELQELIEKNYS